MNELKTLFKKVDYDLSGDIGLPDIQRPFVWTATKVRDLFDSMYRGFPIGYLLFWANTNVDGSKQIGIDTKQHKVPRLLIVDGQQRLTSLYSVFRGKPVLDENYLERRIEIAFRPRDGKFEVADAAIRRDPEFIADVSVLWASGKSSWQLVNDFLRQLRSKGPLSTSEEEAISHNLDRLFDIQKYPFTALEIAEIVNEEQVADIFVRINSEGVKLNQADFILTLLSVFGEDIRIELEKFSRESRIPPSGKPSSFNHFIQVTPDQLLRVAIAIGFNRGRLKSVYQILRGKNLETDEYSPELRDQQFGKLRESKDTTLNLTYWHQFFNGLIGAGFRSGELISSENALLYSYAFYLIGKTRFGISDHVMDKLIGRWFYAVTLSGRYTGSPETVMDGDMNLIKELKNSDAFIQTLLKIINDTLTNDSWSITIPNELDSSSPRSPVLFGFYAAQNVLNAPVLFSKKRVRDLLDPSVKSTKKSLERHHLFPRAYLESLGVDDLKQINQAANFALLEWPDNIQISDESPANYVSKMRQRFKPDDWDEMCRLHALPQGWENMTYEKFLVGRRQLMAKIIREGFETLT